MSTGSKFISLSTAANCLMYQARETRLLQRCCRIAKAMLEKMGHDTDIDTVEKGAKFIMGNDRDLLSCMPADLTEEERYEWIWSHKEKFATYFAEEHGLESQ